MLNRVIGALCGGLLVAAFGSAVVRSQAAPDALVTRVHALQRQVPLIDGHNDLPWAMRESVGYDFGKYDIRVRQPKLMTDIPRIKAGGLGGQFWSVYIPATVPAQHAVSATLEQIDAVYAMVRRYPDAFALARTADDVERLFKGGKVASLIGMEGGHSIDSSLGTLRMFRELGAAYLTLTHNSNTPWADAAADAPRLGGLSKFGEEVVREMNRIGMLVDLSHVSPDTMADAIRVSAAPVIFSHSSARAICDVPRNVPDDILRQLPRNGGVVMVTFVPGFIAPEAGPRSRAIDQERRRLRGQLGDDAKAIEAAMARFAAANPEPKATLPQVADHIDHIRRVAGIDHIGIGGDFDGITSVVGGLEDVSTYPALFAELLRRGYSDEDVRKIIGKNILRVMRQAGQVSRTQQAARGPSLATLESLDGPAKPE